ncbi:MAG: tyrosine-type recombinase/integrase [Lachnospiraceae bacterium]|nr:tyrosine-type recombinase/integrase [Lachnospiraceae bacterium]
MDYSFNSSFAADMQGLMELKVALGYSAETYLPKARAFDEFCTIHYPGLDVITEPMAVHWIKYSYENRPGSVHERITFLRVLGKYQNAMGKNAYIMQESYTSGKSVFMPYIMTDSEMTELFAAIDSLYPKNGFKQLQVSTYFRLTYTCGLRPREGRELLRKDVDLYTSEIRLVNTKWHKSRTVVMSEDMTGLMKEYISIRDLKYDANTYLFPKPQGGPYTAAAIMNAFRKAFAKSKPDIDKDLLPAIRVYDLRHRFATKVLHNWLDAGVDLNSRLPYLQTYMGHKEINATSYYVHLLPENLVKSAGVDWDKLSELLPEVELWEK